MRTATIYNYLVEAALIGSVLILLGLVLRPLCRRIVGSRVLCLAWLLIVLRLLVPLALPNPAMNALKPTLSQDPGIRPMADQVRTRVEDTARDLYWKTLDHAAPDTPVAALMLRIMYAAGNGRLSRLLMGVYAIGAALSAAWMLGQNIAFRRRMNRLAAGSLPPEQQAAYEAQCAQRKLRPLQVHFVQDLPGSCRMGRQVYLPAGAPQELLPAMLLRETSHRYLTLHAILRNVCCVVHWFNPLVWFAAHLSRMDLELACDERAVAPMDEPQRKAYARLMLSARDVRRARPGLTVAASCCTLAASMQKLRINRVLHMQPVRRWAIAAYAVGCVLLGLMMFSTDVQTSLANLPHLEQKSIRPREVIATQEDAQHFAQAFLTLEGIGADLAEQPAYIAQTSAGWLVEWYEKQGASPILLSFTAEGSVLSYLNPVHNTDKLHPLASPITHGSLEGQPWCTFLAEFTRLHMPECFAAYEAMEIVRSGRLDGEQFIIVHLLSAEKLPLWEVAVQVAPEGRILSFASVQ